MFEDIILNIMVKGVPDYLQKLLSIEKKSELIKYCRDITVTQEDLVRLIVNSYSIGYLYKRKHHDFVPQHLRTTDTEKGALGTAKVGEKLTGDAKKFINKISQTFKQRRMLSVHIFYNSEKWHLFYFDQEDIEDRENHWKHGPHIHFVNYLWPNLDINNLWVFFDKVEGSAAGKIHVRFREPERLQTVL